MQNLFFFKLQKSTSIKIANTVNNKNYSDDMKRKNIYSYE